MFVVYYVVLYYILYMVVYRVFTDDMLLNPIYHVCRTPPFFQQWQAQKKTAGKA